MHTHTYGKEAALERHPNAFSCTYTFPSYSLYFFHFISVRFVFAVVATAAADAAGFFCLFHSICVCFYLPQYSFDMRTFEIVS